MSRAAEARRALGAAAAVCPTTAAEWLPWGRNDALAWLRARGLVRTVPDVAGGVREVVIWGEVLDAIRGIAPANPRKERRAAPAFIDPDS